MGLDFENAVNAHCHSEWNAAQCLARGDGMMKWLERVLAFGAPRDVEAGCRATADLARREGIRFTRDHGRIASAVAAGSISGIHHVEILRDDAPPADASIAIAPHAVHTVFAATWERLSGWRGPVSVHAGESPEEMEIYRSGGGPLAKLLSARGFPDGPLASLKGRSPCRILDEHGLLGSGTFLVHALHLDDSDLDLAAERGATIVLCPVSNRDIGVGFRDPDDPRDPGRRIVAAVRDRGIRSAIGTDSALSAGVLSLEENARLVRRFGG